MVMKKRYKIPLIVFGTIAVIFFIGVLARIPYVLKERKTAGQVEKIHDTKLTMDDVMGNNLPPDPGAEADKTIAGIDANKNGIRDDVELAIFKEYPNSAKTRAVLLQYALALQMEAVQEVVNRGVVGEVANKQDRAFFCIAKIVPGGGEGSVFIAIEKYGQLISDKQFNTEERKNAHKHFYSYLKSGRIDDSVSCDVNPFSLTDSL